MPTWCSMTRTCSHTCSYRFVNLSHDCDLVIDQPPSKKIVQIGGMSCCQHNTTDYWTVFVPFNAEVISRTNFSPAMELPAYVSSCVSVTFSDDGVTSSIEGRGGRPTSRKESQGECRIQGDVMNHNFLPGCAMRVQGSQSSLGITSIQRDA